MPAMEVNLKGDCWTDLGDRPVADVIRGDWKSSAILREGMQSGEPSVALRIDLPDGSIVMAETSLALFMSAARGFQIRAEAWARGEE